MFKKIKALITMCPECEVEREVQYGSKEETVNVRREKIKVTSRVYYCPVGKHYFSDIEDDEKKIQFVYREYRKRRNLLQPNEIKKIRDKCKLTQHEFSIFLGYGDKTITRYETGAIPDESHNNFIKLVQDTNSFLTHFNNIKIKLPIKLRRKIEKYLQELEKTQPQLTIPETYTSLAHAYTQSVVCGVTTANEGVQIGSMAISWATDAGEVVAARHKDKALLDFNKKDDYQEELALAA